MPKQSRDMLCTMRVYKVKKLCWLAAITCLGTAAWTFIYSVPLTEHQETVAFTVDDVVSRPDTGAVAGQLRYMDFVISDNVTYVPPQCKPVQNLVFVKTHKTGSSTMASILQRFGVTRGLNFVLPRKKLGSYGYNYITRVNEVFSSDKVLPLAPGQVYNILWNHAIYNRTAFRALMPQDTVYFSIMREPFQQFISSFEYYGVAKQVRRLGGAFANTTNPVSDYLLNHFRLHKHLTYFDYVKNKQAQDLGLNKEHVFNKDKLQAYITQMDSDFRLIMIMEHFDESLLILKHELCWELKDILYIPKNINKRKSIRNYTENDHKQHQRIGRLDYVLYHHYLQVFKEKLNSQSPDFHQELAYFQKLLQLVKNNCERKTGFSVSETRWHSEFEVSAKDCALLTMSELSGLNYILKQHGERLGNVTKAPVTGSRHSL